LFFYIFAVLSLHDNNDNIGEMKHEAFSLSGAVPCPPVW